MASIASELSDKVVLTLITQDPDIIIKEMEEGVAAENYKKVLAITDKTSIKTACQLAQPNDIILIAGKGMKPIKKLMECVDFDDMKIVKEILEQLYK
jgi:UDP-N-acetylmuramoyl-L-alanyl-D-glutamate--2,6-diaminopimelate ligase